MRFGDFEIHLLVEGGWQPDGGAIFGVVPKVLWERRQPADERNLIPSACIGAVIRADGKTIVCETGIGTKLDAKRAKAYGVWAPEGLLGGLQRLGVRPDEVDLVVTTHLHWDHAGGFTRRRADGGYEVTFPNAKHVVQRSEWDFALRPDPRSKAAYLEEDLLPVADKGLVEFVDGDAELLPGLHVRKTGGHSPGHQLIIARGGDGELAAVLCGDLIGLRPHLRLPWIPAADLDVLKTIEEKARLLDEASRNRWLLLLGHEVEHPAGYVDDTGEWLVHQELDDEAREARRRWEPAASAAGEAPPVQHER